MNAGRELDVLVAERVLGLTIKRTAGGTPYDSAQLSAWVNPDVDLIVDGSWARAQVPSYSSDIVAAWQVAEKLASVVFETEDTVWHQTVTVYSCPASTGCWHCRVDREFADEAWDDTPCSGDSAAHAICLAALKAVGAGVIA